MGSTTSRTDFPSAWGTRALLVVGLAALAIYDVAYLGLWLAQRPEPSFGDFFGLWSFGRFVRQAGGAVYDPKALAAFQHALDPGFSGGYPCPYPPPFLLVLAPLGASTRRKGGG